MIRRSNIRALAEKQTGLHPTDDAPILRLPGKRWLFVHDGRLHDWTPKQDRSVAVGGIQLEVNASGQIARSFSGAGMLAFGLVGSTRKHDSRQLFLVAQGLDGAFVLSLHPDAHHAALSFAANMNAYARSAELAQAL